MRMKFTKVSQLVLVSVLGLGLASLLTACQIVTADYVFVANSASIDSSSNGEIQIFALDSETGALRSGGTTVSSGGSTPVALATTTDYAHLYVANSGSLNVVHFAVSSGGALTVKDKATLTTAPVALAVNPANSYLYVVSGTSSATLTEYSLSSGAIGNATSTISLKLPSYPNDTLIPTAVTVMPNGKAVYVTAYDQSAYNPSGTVTSDANPGWVFGYSIGADGALTAISSTPWKAGVMPSGIVADLTDHYVYVTDYASNQLIGYAIQDVDELEYLTAGPFKTGSEPSAIAIDPRGTHLYITNLLDATVSAFSIDLKSGSPSSVANTTGSATNSTETEPVAIAIDPAQGRYVYTANKLGNSLSGFSINMDAGSLKTTQANPYPTGSNPTAIVIVPHGNHASQWVDSSN
jgi:6-phosphogluconolactonase (cycloisomerase 2 family)